jgi:hypothetical protein
MHGSLSRCDTLVPIKFSGAGICPKLANRLVQTTDEAPSNAALPEMTPTGLAVSLLLPEAGEEH